MANKAFGQCDGCGFALGDGDAFVGIGGYGGGSLEDGVRLGAGTAVGDVEAGAFAFVCRGSGIEKGFQRARDPRAGVLYSSRGRESWRDCGGE